MSYENVPKNLTEQAVLVRGGRPDYFKLDADPFPTPTADEAGAILEVTDTGDRYRWSSTAWYKVAVASANLPRDYYIEVTKGNIPGEALYPVLGRIAATAGGSTFEDWRSLGGTMNKPTVAESLEIVSDDVNDTSAGTGARTVAVPTLDANYVRGTQIATMNGTTPVALTGTHIRPGNGAAVLTVGTNAANSNIGNIKIRKAGTATNPDVRMYIPATQGLSKDAHYTVPAGKTAYVLQATFFYPKDEDGISRNVITPLAAASLTGLDIPFYQFSFQFEVRAPFPLAEKTDLFFKVATTNIGVELQSIYDMLEIDN